ncbi:hypothetical protein [Ruthenibacterium intestinale]|uniref:hypothetical protein n=1 Tax=Ruthenibacterium intestinale TaxID=3133163 RepID=UPI0032C0E6F9
METVSSSAQNSFLPGREQVFARTPNKTKRQNPARAHHNKDNTSYKKSPIREYLATKAMPHDLMGDSNIIASRIFRVIGITIAKSVPFHEHFIFTDGLFCLNISDRYN